MYLNHLESNLWFTEGAGPLQGQQMPQVLLINKV